MHRSDLAVLPMGMLVLGLTLAACEKSEPKADTAPKAVAKAPASDAKPPAPTAPEAKAPVPDVKAPPAPAVDTAAPPEPPTPPTEATPTTGGKPTGPVVVVEGGGDEEVVDEEEPRETSLDLTYETIGGVHIGMTAADVVAKLGKPKKQSKVTMEGATGDYAQTWHYEGLEVGMSSPSRKGAQKVSFLEASAACKLPASWGLGIGSTRAEVEKVYAACLMPDLSGPDELLAGSVYAGVTFGFKDDKVTRIFIGGGE